MDKPTRDLLYQRAIAELGIDVPVYLWRIVGRRIEIALYGGQLVTWPLPPDFDPGPASPPGALGAPSSLGTQRRPQNAPEQGKKDACAVGRSRPNLEHRKEPKHER